MSDIDDWDRSKNEYFRERDALTEERDRLKADIRRILEEHARIIELNKAHCRTVNSYILDNSRRDDALKASEAERDRLERDRDFWKEQFQVETRYRIELADKGTLQALTDANIRMEKAEAERDRLALANAELLAAFDDLMSWFPDKPTEPMWQMKAGEWGADAAIDEARALLTKHKATSTEPEGE